jgi:hypothetical protein
MGGCLKRVTGSFIPHVVSRNMAQLIVISLSGLAVTQSLAIIAEVESKKSYVLSLWYASRSIRNRPWPATSHPRE